MSKGRKLFSTVFAFVFTMFTLLSNMPVKAAIKKTAIPEVQFASVQKTEYMAGDRIQFNIISPNYGGKVEYRVVLWDDTKKSYSDLWNEKNGYPNRYYSKWQPTGNTVFTLGWPITEPGNYRITVYAKRVGVASGKAFLKGMNCDSYKESAAFTVKPKVTLFDKAGQVYGSSDANKPEAYKEEIKITAKDITLSNAKLEGNLYIAGDNAVIKNVSAAGKIVVDPGKEGIATLDNVAAKSIEVLSGGQNSIHIKDVKAEYMNVGSSAPVRIEVDGDTEIVSTSANGYVIFDRKSGTFGTITVTKGSNGDTVIEFRGDIRDRVEVETTATIKTAENSKVFNLVVNTGFVKLEGNYEKVEINSQAKVEAGADTKLKIIVAHEDAEIYLDKTAAVGNVDKGNNTVTIIKDGQTEPGSPSGTGDGGGGYIPPPAAISAVTVTGSNVVGQTLTAALTPSNAAAAYQWKRSDTIDGTYTDIAGATAKTYTLTKDDAGKYIKVTAVGTGRYTGARISGATEVIIGISVETFHILDINGLGFGVGVNQIVTLLGTTYADSDNANNWVIDTGTTNLQFLYITKIGTNRVVITYTLKSAGQGTGVGTVTIKAKASAVAANRDTNSVSLVTTQNDANKAAAAKAAIEGADYTKLGVGDINDNAQKEAAIRAVVNGIKGETAALIYNLGPNYYVIISMNEAGEMADINPVTFASNKAELAGVAGLKDNTPGTQTGADALNAIEWEISVDTGKSKLAPGDITASPNAAIKLYSDNTFTTEVNDTDGLALASGHTTAYIKVTAEDGRTVKYYAVDIYRELPAQTGAAITGLNIPANVLQMGEAETRTASTFEAGAGNWTSSNAAVAEIDPITGIVTAKAPGTTVIAYTTSNSGNVNSIPIEVYNYAVIDAPEIGEVRVGAGNVTPAGYINATAGQTISWTSSDVSKASVNSSTGLITPVAPGSTTISYKVTETSTGRIAAKGQMEITVQQAKTVSIGDIDGAIMAQTPSTDRHYTVTTFNIADGKAAAIIWIDQFGNPNAAAVPPGITITPAGPVFGGLLTLNVAVNAAAPTYAGNYRFRVVIDGAESDIKILTIGNSAYITGATLDWRSTVYTNECLIINMDKIDYDSNFDISKFACSNGGQVCPLLGFYQEKEDGPFQYGIDYKGYYYYDSIGKQLIIALTEDDCTGISLLSGTGIYALVATTGWNTSHDIPADTIMNCPMTVTGP